MDFSVSGSDLWDSTPSQEVFIKGYFREPSPGKKALKKKRRISGQTNFGGLKEITALATAEKMNEKSPNSQITSKKFLSSKLSENSLNRSEKETFNLKLSVSNYTSLSGKSNTGTNNSKPKKAMFDTLELPTTELDSIAKKIKINRKKHKKDKTCNESKSNVVSEAGDSEGKNDSEDDAIRNEIINTSTYEKFQNSPNSKAASKKFSSSKLSENSLNRSQTKTFNLKKSVSNSTSMGGNSKTGANNLKPKKGMFDTLEPPNTELSIAKEKEININRKKLKKDKTCHKSKFNIVSEDGDSDDEDEDSDDEDESEAGDSEGEDDSEDDTIRNEIINTSTYKKLQKLLKLAPYLDPNVDRTLLTEPVTDIEMSVSEDDANSEVEESADEASEDKKPLANSSSSHTKRDSGKVCSKNLSNLKSDETESQLSTSFYKNPKGNLLKNKAIEKLKAAKFRYLNEKLYTETGHDAFQYFQDNVEEFEEYHSGYTIQVTKWPMNPVDEIIAQIQQLKKGIVIADLGCGSAKIAEIFSDRVVHSFDLVAVNDSVTSCDISKVPLAKESVDVAVFCLSLMGTNLKDYLCEAHRILKIGGTLKIAEVESRVEDLNMFIKNITCLGFALERKNTKHKLFVFLDFQKKKLKLKKSKAPKIVLKPCLYKKR